MNKCRRPDIISEDWIEFLDWDPLFVHKAIVTTVTGYNKFGKVKCSCGWHTEGVYYSMHAVYFAWAFSHMGHNGGKATEDGYNKFHNTSVEIFFSDK